MRGYPAQERCVLDKVAKMAEVRRSAGGEAVKGRFLLSLNRIAKGHRWYRMKFAHGTAAGGLGSWSAHVRRAVKSLPRGQVWNKYTGLPYNQAYYLLKEKP